MNSSNNNSSWAIIDPSLRNPDLFVYDFKKTTNLDYALPIYSPSIATNPDTFATHTDDIENKGKNHAKPKQKISPLIKDLKHLSDTSSDNIEKEEKTAVDLINDRINEIVTELADYKNCIFSEKLLSLQKEMATIENETHKSIIRQDRVSKKIKNERLKEIEALYQYHVAAIDKEAEYERSLVMTDIQATIGFANNVINADSSRKKKNKKGLALSPKEDISPTKKIHLGKKVAKLQAIYNRQKDLKAKQLQHKRHLRGSPLEEPVNKNDISCDIQLMKKSIKNAKETSS